MKALQGLLMFALMILLARLLGAEGYGIYAYLFALVQLLGIPAQLGLQALVVREVAAYQARGDWGALRGILRFGFLTIVFSAAVIATIVIALVWGVGQSWTGERLETLQWGLLLMPLLALGSFRGAALRGLKKVVKGLLPEHALQPSFFLFFIFISWLLSDSWLTPSRVMMLQVGAATVAFGIGTRMLHRAIPRDVRGVKAVYDTRKWLLSTLPLSLVIGIQIVNSRADIVMLGILGKPEDVGVYRVAVDGAILVAFGLRAINAVVSPYFSSLWVNAELKMLQRLATSSARGALLFALPVGIILIVFGDGILRTIFGHEFVRGRMTLGIVAVGQIINAAFGSVVALLNMTGHEGIVVRALIFVAVTNIILNAIFIPFWGIEGAATASLFTLLFWNVLLWYVTKSCLGINTWAFGK